MKRKQVVCPTSASHYCNHLHAKLARALMYRISCASRIVLLFHRHALGEVSGLVYVAAAADGYVVGEELEGDYFEDGEEELVGLGDMDDVLD